MSYSAHAVEFRTIRSAAQVRLEDRISFAYVERARVVQDRTGVWCEQVDDSDEFSRVRVQFPVGSIGVILLGPGTSITQPAAATAAAAGCTVVFTGGGGVPSYAAATPLTGSARWAQAQARTWADPDRRRAAAISLYETRFGPVGKIPSSLDALRGMEGARIKTAYAHHAQRAGVTFTRRGAGDDPVNISLNVGNQILYGVAATVCSALSLNPALGLLHDGDRQSFLFDLADAYKTSTTIPVAFAALKADDVPAFTRAQVRSRIARGSMLEGMVQLAQSLFAGALGGDNNLRLLADDGFAAARSNHAPETR